MLVQESEFEQRTRDKLRRDLGPIISAAMADPLTVEIMLNPDGTLWQERLGEPMREIGSLAPHWAEAVINTLASHLDREVSRVSPMVEGELPPDGARFAGQVPPIVSAPTFSIRVPAVRSLSLGQYVMQGVMTQEQRVILEEAVAARENILVVGGTGSGKTTLVNALIAAIVDSAPNDRLVLIEDTREIQCSAQNFVQYRVAPTVGMTELLRTTLRMRPDRILVGEVRGPEALDLLMAWNTGHAGGIATVHANDAVSGLLRLEMLVSMHRHAPARPAPLIAEAVDIIVHIERTPKGRRVKQLCRVLGGEGGVYQTCTL